MIVTIDGPSGTGKTTVARHVASALGFDYFDTGAMYRSVAYGLKIREISPEDEPALCGFLETFGMEVKEIGEMRHYFVDGEDVTHAIRTPEISSQASSVAKLPAVRATLVKLQRAYAEGRNVVFEGRDMGTVVFPKANYKIFLTARPEVRAKRRHLEFPDAQSVEEVRTLMEQRDQEDQTRALSPLKQAEDAHLIDTSDLSIEEVVKTILRVVQ